LIEGPCWARFESRPSRLRVDATGVKAFLAERFGPGVSDAAFSVVKLTA
jgi:hypothetical protein